MCIICNHELWQCCRVRFDVDLNFAMRGVIQSTLIKIDVEMQKSHDAFFFNSKGEYEGVFFVET